MAFWHLAVLALIAILTAIYCFIKNRQLYWQRRNVPTHPALLFYFGREKQTGLFMQDICTNLRDSGHLFAGFFMFFFPSLMLIDLDLIKRIFITNFDHFIDRGFYHNVEDDPLTRNLFRLEGDTWKRLRSKLTPTFSSGKMKYMFPTVVSVAERFIEVLGKLLAVQPNEELEIRDWCARYTTDVIGTVAFGIECNSLQNPHVEFRQKGDIAFSSFRPIVEALGTIYPNLLRKLHVTVFPHELIEFYSVIVKQSIAYREENNIKGNDFLDLLVELKNENALTMDEIIAQAFVFFVAGFETSSITMAYCLLELSHNQCIQDRARKDVLDTLAKHDNQLSYECLREMHYLERAVLETLRKYPVGPFLKRVASKDFHIPDTDFIIEKGMDVYIPVYAIHHDPNNYPEPEKFDPDRFEPAEIQKRHAMTYLPFGAGPRICIAERFAKMQASIGLAMLLKNFKFIATPKTPKRLEFDMHMLRSLSAKCGIYLRVEKF